MQKSSNDYSEKYPVVKPILYVSKNNRLVFRCDVLQDRTTIELKELRAVCDHAIKNKKSRAPRATLLVDRTVFDVFGD